MMKDIRDGEGGQQNSSDGTAPLPATDCTVPTLHSIVPLISLLLRMEELERTLKSQYGFLIARLRMQIKKKNKKI